MAIAKMWLLPAYGYCQDVVIASMWLLPAYGYCQDVVIASIWLLLLYSIYGTEVQCKWKVKITRNKRVLDINHPNDGPLYPMLFSAIDSHGKNHMLTRTCQALIA